MRCLCYAKFLSEGAIPPDEFCAHIGSIWSCIEDIPKTSSKSSNLGLIQNHQLPTSIFFIADCKSVAQLTSDLETMPGAGNGRILISITRYCPYDTTIGFNPQTWPGYLVAIAATFRHEFIVPVEMAFFDTDKVTQ